MLLPSQPWSVESARWFSIALADHLWQSTVIALMALLAARLLRRAPARMRYTALLLGMLKFAFPVVPLGRIVGLEPVFNSAAAKLGFHNQTSYFLLTHGVEPVSYAARLTEWQDIYVPPTLFEIIVAIWLIGSVLLFALWTARRLIFSARLKSDPLTNNGSQELDVLKRLCSQLGLRGKVNLITSDEIDIPGVWGIIRSVILLPPDLALRLDKQEFETVILHELVHIKRHDNTAALLQIILCNLFWFHPLIWMLHFQLMRERELHCDEEVVRITGAAQQYASGILKVLESCLKDTAPGISSIAKVSEARMRFDKILSSEATPVRQGRHQIALLTLYAVLTVVIFFISFLAGNRYSRSAISSKANVLVKIKHAYDP